MRRLSKSEPLAHELLVIVDYNREVKLEGYSFGQEHRDGGTWYAICISKGEFEKNGIECKGPCINKQYPASRVSFPNGAPRAIEIKEEPSVIRKGPKSTEDKKPSKMKAILSSKEVDISKTLPKELREKMKKAKPKKIIPKKIKKSKVKK